MCNLLAYYFMSEMQQSRVWDNFQVPARTLQVQLLRKVDLLFIIIIIKDIYTAQIRKATNVAHCCSFCL